MKYVILILVYLIGYFVSYLLMRYEIRKRKSNWNEGDRVCTLVVAIVSWVSVFTMLGFMVLGYFYKLKDSEKPVSW